MGSALLTASDSSWDWPTGVTELVAELLGGGGGGGGVTHNTEGAGGGGRGGSYVRVTVTKGGESYLDIVVGSSGSAGTSANGGNGGYSSITQDVTVVALAPGGVGGAGGADNSGYAGATTDNGTAVYTGGTYYAGGSGGTGNITSNYSGGGGGAAGPASAGGTTTNNAAGARGTGTWQDDSTTRNTAGAAGRTTGGVGASASNYGGAGAGGYATSTTNRNGGAGGAGVVLLTWVDPPVAVSDDFNRANESPLGGNWTSYNNGGTYVVLSSNQVQSNDGVWNAWTYYNAEAFADDQYSQVEYVSVDLSESSGPAVRVHANGTDGTPNGYYLAFGGGDGWIWCAYDIEEGGELVGTTFSLSVSATDTIGLVIVGYTIYVYKNDVLIATRTDTNSRIASGSPGFVIQGSEVYDNFYGGDYVEEPAAPTGGLFISRSRIVNCGGYGGASRSSVVNSGGN